MFLDRVMSWRTIGRSSGQKINVEAASRRNVCNIVHIKHTFVQLEKMYSPSRPHVQTLSVIRATYFDVVCHWLEGL